MSWPRKHELIDIDLDAYADDVDAAERAGIPLEELLHQLSW